MNQKCQKKSSMNTTLKIMYYVKVLIELILFNWFFTQKILNFLNVNEDEYPR